MNINEIAESLINLKEISETATINYNNKRSEMYNCFTNTQTNEFEFNGFRIKKTNNSNPSFRADKVLLRTALEEANLSADVISEIFRKSLKEIDGRDSGIKINKIT